MTERRRSGRPPRHSLAEITAAAIAIADREGLDAVSMRRVAADLGTGAASLYRYLDAREDLLDLMSDAAGADYALSPVTGDWLADAVGIGMQVRSIMRRHPWLADLVPRRPVLGPNGLTLIQHFLEALEPHPADGAAKLEAFAVLMAVTAVTVQSELAGGSDTQRRNAAYLGQALASDKYARLRHLLADSQADAADSQDRYFEVMSRIMAGLLGPVTGSS